MQTTIQLQNVDYTQLLDDLETRIEAAINRKPIAKEDEKFLSPIQAARMFGVSVVTIHAWANDGLITRYKLGVKTYFKLSELVRAAKPVITQ